MLGLIQRVSRAAVDVDGTTVGQIDNGILLLLGVQPGDTEAEANKLLHKVLHYRIFPDQNDKMNLNVQQAGGGLLVVSQFTLAADTRKGLRPSFTTAAPPAEAERLYDHFVACAKQAHPSTAAGVFSANMQVTLCNDGPVTFMLEA